MYAIRSYYGLDRTIAQLRPSAVVVQGDTTTTFCGALAAFYHRIEIIVVDNVV